MSSILYGAETSMDAGSVLSSGFHIIGLQHSTNIGGEDSSGESEIETGSINDFVSSTAEFDFISAEVTEGILDTETGGVSEAAASDLTETSTGSEASPEAFGRDTSNLEFFPDDSDVMGEFGKGMASESEIDREFVFDEQDITAMDNQQGFDIF